MKFTITSQDRYTIFEVEGSLSIENLLNLENSLKPEVDAKKHILMDLSKLSFIDSSAIRFIIHYFYESQRCDRLLCLVNLNNEIAQVFSITELDQKIKMFSSTQEALDYIKRK